MKATQLLLTALMISLSAGAAFADNHHPHHDKVVIKQTRVVQQPHNHWQHQDYKAQSRHSKSYRPHIRDHESRRTRIARLIHAKQLKRQHHRKQLAAQVQCYNNNRHTQLRTGQIIVPLPIPRVALFFPW